MSRVLALALCLGYVGGPAIGQTLDERLVVVRDHLEQGKLDAAETALVDLRRAYPGLVEVEESWGDLLERRGRTREAVEHFLGTGQALVRSTEVDAGVRFLERAVALAPAMPAAHAALGHGHLQAQRYRQAAAHLSKALELGETSPMAQLLHGAALWELGSYDEAERAYRDLLGQAGPAAGAARRSLGALLVFRGSFEPAVPLLGAALGESPEDVQVRYDLARALEGAGRQAEAIELYRAVLETAPEFLQAHYRLARLYRAADQAGLSAFHLERFSNLHSVHQAETRAEGRLAARLNRGWSLLREGEVELALNLFRDLPPGPESLRGLAEALYRSGDRAGARRAIEMLLEADPERFDLRLLLDEWGLEEGS